MASIIIPHYNGRHHLPVCLNALEAQTFTDFETILVDNGSTDGSQAYVRDHHPAVRLIEMGRNAGFTGACNAGYRAARGRFILLLNNDTEVDPGWVAAIVDVMQEMPRVGVVASKMLLFDKRTHLHTAGDFVRLNGIAGNRGVWRADDGQYDRREPVFSACGGAVGYRRAMLDEIGFLDDLFFFSLEDVDLAWRAQLAGWDVIYEPLAVVYHKLKATGGSVTGSYYDGRNRLLVIAKNYPTALLRRHWRAVIGAQLVLTRDALRHWRGAAARATLRGQLAGLILLPRVLGKRRRIQAQRRLSADTLAKRLTAVDVTP